MWTTAVLLTLALAGLPAPRQAAGGAGPRADRTADECLCNPDSVTETPCAARRRALTSRERRAWREIQARIDATVEADKSEDLEAATRFNTPDFVAETTRGTTLSLADVKGHIQRNYDYIIKIDDRTNVRIDCIVLEGSAALVWINQHFVRTVPFGEDRTPRELVTNVTHEETWVRTRTGWLRSRIKELRGGPYFLDGKPYAPTP